jgi:hypothetical protein
MPSFPVVHVLAFGVARVTTTLTAERLTVVTTGGIGPSLDVPVAAIRHVYVEELPTPGHGPRGAVLRAGQAIGGDVVLIVSWTEGGKRRTKRLPAQSKSPTFQAIVDGLVALRPEASLLGLPEREALPRMGLLSYRMRSIATIAVVIVVAVVVQALRAWLGR